MDVCAFVGVSPRGPAYPPAFDAWWAPKRDRVRGERVRSLPVAVDSWAQYEATFGGFDGPGRLPYAVASFFENGGRRAYVVRVVGAISDTDVNDGVARGPLLGVTGPAEGVWLRARSEGSWGNALGARLETSWRPVAFDATRSTASALSLPRDSEVAAGTHVRCECADGSVVVRLVLRVDEAWVATSTRRRREAVLDAPLPDLPLDAAFARGTLVVFEADVEVERFEDIGFGAAHPRFLARVLVEASAYLYPAQRRDDAGGWRDVSWSGSNIDVPVDGVVGHTARLNDGADRYGDITHDDFFSDWLPGNEVAGDGVHALVDLPDLGLFTVPDLYVFDEMPPPIEEVASSLAGPTFGPCKTPVGVIRYAAVELELRSAAGGGVAVGTVAEGTPLTVVPDALDVFDVGDWLHVRGLGTGGFALVGWADKSQLTDAGRYDAVPPALDQLHLNPNADFDAIVALQRRLVALAEHLRGPIVLLDVPPQLSDARIERWRARFDAAFAAAYHPWLRVQRTDDGREAAVVLNPSAVAAGIIASREIRHGVHYGPANQVAASVVETADRLSRGVEDRLHPVGINMFRLERDGVRLLGARTLSYEAAYRQLNVRRTMTMIERSLQQQMQWLVFEPNNEGTWRDVRQTITAFLRRLHRDRALEGKAETEAFFVRCDASINDRRRTDRGQLLAEIGVALAEPIEFLLVRIVRETDDAIVVEGP